MTWVALASGLRAGHPGPRFGCLLSGTGKFAVGVGCRDSHICSLLALPAPHSGLKLHKGCRHQLGVVRKGLSFPVSCLDPTVPLTPLPPRPNHRQLIWCLREEQVLGDRNPTRLPKTTCGPQNHTQGLSCATICFLPVIQL